MPWLRSGRAWRNSYEVVRTADRLGLVANGYESVLAVCWYLVPFLCGLTLTAIVLDRHVAGASRLDRDRRSRRAHGSGGNAAHASPPVAAPRSRRSERFW